MERISNSLRSSILMLLVLLLFSPLAIAQQRNVSINVRNISLKEFFNVIEKQTDYNFSYRDSELEGKGKVTVKVENADLASLLSAELAKVGLCHTFVNDKIVITPLEPAKQDVSPTTVSGVVLDRSGNPVVGASALIKGTTNGAVTDLDGKFSVEVKKGDVLVFSS